MQRPPESKRPPVDPASIPETEEKPPDPLEEQAAAGWLPGEVGLLATPFERHPAAERHLALARQDVLQTGLVRGEDIQRFERFAQLDALVYPRASFEALQACGGFNHWLFFIDDHYDTDASFAACPERVDDLMQRAFDTLATGHLPHKPAPLDRFRSSRPVRSRCRKPAPTATTQNKFADILDVRARNQARPRAASGSGSSNTPTGLRAIRRS
jgi:hypothetical protein